MKHKHKWNKIWAKMMPRVEGWVYVCDCGSCKEVKKKEDLENEVKNWLSQGEAREWPEVVALIQDKEREAKKELAEDLIRWAEEKIDRHSYTDAEKEFITIGQREILYALISKLKEYKKLNKIK